MKKQILSTLIMGFSAFLLCFPISEANAKITRTCKATYEIYVFSSNWDYIGRGDFAAFSASGRCGDLVPDRCRRRARDRAIACMEEHHDDWYYQQFPFYHAGWSRWVSKPPMCESSRIQNYNYQNLSQSVRNKAALIKYNDSYWRNRSGQFYVQVRAVSFKDTYPYGTGSDCNKQVHLGTNASTAASEDHRQHARKSAINHGAAINMAVLF